MNNIITKLFLLAISVFMLSSASLPSIEGRASVAEIGELPPGMYIKAHTFLPGDSVIITNPATKVSIEVFVFATIDEGVAAVVSEEVAEKLFITDNSDTIVQIRKVVAPTGIADEDLRFSQTVQEPFIDDSEVFTSNQSRNETVVIEPKATEVAVEELSTDVAEDTVVVPVVEDVNAELTPEESILVNDEPTEATPVVALVEDVSDSEIQENDIVAEAVEEEAIESEDVVAVEDPMLTEITDIIVSSEDLTPDSDEAAVVYTPFADMSTLFSSETLASETVVETTESIEDTVVIDEKSTESAAVVVEEVVAIDETLVETVVDVEDVIKEDIVIIATEEEKFEMTALTESSEEVPNTLTPTVENPPVFEGITEEPIVTFNADYIVTSSEDIVTPSTEIESVDIFAITPAVKSEPEENISSFSGSIFDYVVSDITTVGNKRYYIQLATYKDESNINFVLGNYSDNYPIALLESSVIHNAYQVMVGPLTKDEYTVVLERFKSFGYKDAFLRIAN